MNTKECIETLEKVIEQLKKDSFCDNKICKWYELYKRQDASVKEIHYMYIQKVEYDKQFNVYEVYGSLIKYRLKCYPNNVFKTYNYYPDFHTTLPAKDFHELREASKEEVDKYYMSWQKEFVE